MKKILLSAILAMSTTALPAAAGEALVSFQVLSPETALTAAQAALADCRKRGYQVAVSVVDRSGLAQVMLRDWFAGPHTPDTSRRKAWTTVSFRTDSGELATATASGAPQSGARGVEGALMLGGGLRIDAAGAMVGAIGVSGAPGGPEDEACARAGIAAIQDSLNF